MTRNWSKTQTIALQVMARYDVPASVFRSKDKGVFALLRRMRNKIHASTLLALERKGLIETVIEQDWHERRFILTKAGREKAKRLQGGQTEHRTEWGRNKGGCEKDGSKPSQ